MLDPDKATLKERIATRGLTPVIAASLPHQPIKPALAILVSLGATIVRLGLTTVLCGDSAATLDWSERVAHVRSSLARHGPIAAGHGVTLAIENHQDFTSAELVAFRE